MNDQQPPKRRPTLDEFREAHTAELRALAKAFAQQYVNNGCEPRPIRRVPRLPKPAPPTPLLPGFIPPRKGGGR